MKLFPCTGKMFCSICKRGIMWQEKKIEGQKKVLKIESLKFTVL
jgi:uncharacterized Zn finger protein (UPF0148 family)